jgi:hypothetical protein
MIHEPPVCLLCRHYHRSGFRTCDAFPERIPDEIWVYVNPHTQPIPGDHGIHFEPIEKPVKAKAARIPSRRR